MKTRITLHTKRCHACRRRAIVLLNPARLKLAGMVIACRRCYNPTTEGKAA